MRIRVHSSLHNLEIGLKKKRQQEIRLVMPLFPCTVFNKNVLPVIVFLTCQISWIKALYVEKLTKFFIQK